MADYLVEEGRSRLGRSTRVPSNHLRLQVLGSLVALVHGVAVPLGGVKQRSVLAALALEPNEVVSVDRLVDAVWGEDPPDRPNGVLQVYVANLRKVLEGARLEGESPRVLVRRPPGYMLVVDDEAVDLSEFTSLVEQSRSATAEGRFDHASLLLRQALALSRGPLLADLQDQSWFEADRVSFAEQRLAALEARIASDLQLGRQLGLVPELEALTAAHPLREGLWEKLIVALYRSGRQGDALEAYQRVRRHLQDELGVDPAPALRDLERFVLAQSKQLAMEGSGRAFLTWTDGGGDHQVLPLDGHRPRVGLGRRSDNDVSLAWDSSVSRQHAVLDFHDGAWHLQDSGSSNGTFLNGDRVVGLRALRHGDVLRVGATALVFRWPDGVPEAPGTVSGLTAQPTHTGAAEQR